MVRVRYTLGLVRLYGIEFPPNVWKEVGPVILTKKELQALCDEKGLEYKKLDNKAKLLELLQ